MNGAHYSQQHIALGRFIKKHYNQSSVTVPCLIDEKKQANMEDQHMKTSGDLKQPLALTSRTYTLPKPKYYPQKGLRHFSQCCRHVSISK